MAVNWQCTTCAAYKAAMTKDEDSDDWREFVSLRDSLIYALLVTQFPVIDDDGGHWAIMKDNWEETYIRLYMYEHAMQPMRVDPKIGAPKIYFTPSEVRSMIGLHVNAGTQSQEDFEQHLLRLIRRDGEYKLNQYRLKINGVDKN